ncbi:MAG: hypothetical protein ACHQ1D_01140 [Nitrososphaerales archaeon]
MNKFSCVECGAVGRFRNSLEVKKNGWDKKKDGWVCNACLEEYDTDYEIPKEVKE